MGIIDLIKRLPEIFLDDSGKVSMAKVMIVCIIIMMWEIVNVYLTFAILEFFSTKKIPQWPVAVAGLVTALGGVIGIFYGVNKFSPVIPFIKKSDTGQGDKANG